MREILFRGKRADNGEWVYGYYAHRPTAVCIGESNPSCIYVPACDPDDNSEFIEVLPETVGQYTGLTDKNGVRIFEGDILDVSSDVAYGGVAVHRLGYFVVEFHNGCFMKSALDDPQLSFFDNAKRKGLYHFISTDIHKIVGNIHDNPEILKTPSL